MKMGTIPSVSIPYRTFTHFHSIEDTNHFFKKVRKMEKFLPFCVFLGGFRAPASDKGKISVFSAKMGGFLN